jgi:hypothetical protein
MPVLNSSAQDFPCSEYKSVQIVLAAPTIAPANGYKVRWRVQGSTTWYDYPDQTGTNITIIGVPACYNIEVGISAKCDGAVGTEVIASVQGSSTTCYSYTLNDDAVYYYTPCNSNQPSSITIVASAPQPQRIVCAKQNTITGGSFTQGSSCTPTP